VIDTKLDFYRSHEHNRCIMVIRQDEMEVALHLRGPDDAWPDSPLVLRSSADVIELAGIGQVCTVGALYEGTSVGVRPARRR
jgi:hypothetical protein